MRSRSSGRGGGGGGGEGRGGGGWGGGGGGRLDVELAEDRVGSASNSTNCDQVRAAVE